MIKAVIGSAVLYHGDCFEILPEIAGASAVISDPPYGCTKCDWDHDIDLAKFWELATPACQPGAVFCLFCQMPFAARLYTSNPREFRYEWIYRKPHAAGFLGAQKRPLRGHELVYVFCAQNPRYCPLMRKGEPYKVTCRKSSENYGQTPVCTDNKTGDRYPTSIIEVRFDSALFCANPVYPRHPTQKSVNALSYLVKTHTLEGEVVLDPFMGSGTTGVAAIRHGRRFIGIERERKWFDVACQRIAAECQGRGLLDLAACG